MADLREKRVELILQQLEELPSLPAAAQRVLQVSADDPSAITEAALLIAADASLTTGFLLLLNRTQNSGQALLSVDDAIAREGFGAVRNAVLAVSVFQAFGTVLPAQGAAAASGAAKLSRDEFWNHSIAVACCAEMLAEATRPRLGRGGQGFTVSDAFLCGLLHDLGKIALDVALPKSFARVLEATDLLRGNIADIERTVIGLDHMVVGKRLAERWQLPAMVRDTAWLHGQPPQALPAHLKIPRLVNLITLADILVREQHLGYSGNYTFSVSKESLADAIELPLIQIHAATAKLVERVELRAAALGLGQATSDALYQRALAQANQELGRVGNQLAAKNRRLSARTQFFDALGHFQAALRPDAAPQAVLSAIARTALQVLSVPCAAAFSLPPGQDFAETLLCDDAGELFETSLIDLPGMAMLTGGSSIRGADAYLVDDPCGFLAAHRGEPDALTLAPALLPEQALDALPSDRLSPVETPLPPPVAMAATEPKHDAASAPLGGPVLSAGEGIEWLVSAVSPRLPHNRRFWICLEADGAMIGGILWGAVEGEAERLGPQAAELCALASGWGLALRAAQIREEARTLVEQLADANRRLNDAQSELLRSKALLTVSEMAAGAAHEMNNPLAVISGRSQLLASQLIDPRQKAAATLIYEQSHRLSGIITDLMDFARPQPALIRAADIGGVVEGALRDAKALHDTADRLFDVNVGDVPPVAVDARQVAAAIAEIVANAIHATDPRSGHIAVDAAYDAYSDQVVVTVTDDGCGMDENTTRRAFDPFFSNKPAGRRRGLGLAKALRWIEASGGSVRLESRLRKGTRAVVLLPADRSEVAAAREDVSSNAPRDSREHETPRQKAI